MSTYATDVSPIVFDIETAPLPNVRDFLDPPDLDDIQAPSNYVKQDAIDGYIDRERAKRLADFEKDCTSKAALDFNCARIVALGMWASEKRSVRWMSTETQEASAIAEFWNAAQHRLIAGFCIRSFDLPMLMQRSRYLDIPCPTLDLGRYARGTGVLDLYDLLTFNDLRGENIMPRSAKCFARRFGIPTPDPIDGKDIPSLVAAGEWEKVASHCAADVDMEVALGKRLGVIQAQPEPAGAL